MVAVKKKILALKNRLIFNIKKPELRILPGSLAFFFFLTLIPLVGLIGNFISLFDLPYESLSSLLENYFPKGTTALLEFITVKIDFKLNFFIFLLTSIMLASNATHSMILVSNQIYKIKDRSYIKRRIKALIMMIVVVILLLFVLFIPVFGNMIFKFIGLIDNTSMIKRIIISLYNILKYPFSLAFIYFFIRMLYILAPDKKIPRQNVTYGSLFTSFSWVILTKIYSVYIENFTNYTTFYGSIASVIILMLWLYLLSYIFVLGMALNATKYELNKIEKNEEK